MGQVCSDGVPEEDLGLPPDYDPALHAKYIPTEDDLKRVAIREVDYWTAFVVTNQTMPEEIAEKLEEIAAFSRAACRVKGNHQTKAIRLGLALGVGYWLKRGMVNNWPHLIMPLLKTALEIGDHKLQSELYQAWGIYLYITDQQPGAITALKAALDYAADSGREDLQLLARTERFNIRVTEITFAEAASEAQDILADARRLTFPYVQGRVYLSLARGLSKAILREQIFDYAQQALAIFDRLGVIDLAGQATSLMLGSVQDQEGASLLYRSRLLTFWESLARRSVNPWFQATTYFFRATDSYHNRSYDRARRYLLEAGARYRAIKHLPDHNRAEVMHMLGLIQTKRHRWSIAERHLRAAYRGYEKDGNTVCAVHAQHALAYISCEQGDFWHALPLLEEVLHRANTLPEDAARDRLARLIQDDIDDAQRNLAGPLGGK